MKNYFKTHQVIQFVMLLYSKTLTVKAKLSSKKHTFGINNLSLFFSKAESALKQK